MQAMRQSGTKNGGTEKIEKAGGIVEPVDNFVHSSTWWFNVPEFLMVVRK